MISREIGAAKKLLKNDETVTSVDLVSAHDLCFDILLLKLLLILPSELRICSKFLISNKTVAEFPSFITPFDRLQPEYSSTDIYPSNPAW